jgi:hypothetical protein
LVKHLRIFTFLYLVLVSTRATGADAWYTGVFSGSFKEESTTMNVKLQCTVDGACEVAIAAADGKGEPYILKEPTKDPYGIEIPNGNLLHTRRVVSLKPSLYSEPMHGALLTSLKPLIESKSMFTSCLNLKREMPETMAVCSVGTGGRALPVYLLMGTMNPVCGDSPFCAFAFVPLVRK